MKHYILGLITVLCTMLLEAGIWISTHNPSEFMFFNSVILMFLGILGLVMVAGHLLEQANK